MAMGELLLVVFVECARPLNKVEIIWWGFGWGKITVGHEWGYLVGCDRFGGDDR